MKAQNSKERLPEDSSRLSRELLGLFAIFCGLLIILSLATFDSRDPWLNHVVSGVTRVNNKAGLFGAYLAGLLYDIVGAASWMLPAFLCLVGARRILGAQGLPWWRWAGFFFLALCLALVGAASDLGDVEIFARGVLPQGAGNVSTHGGGIIGHMLYVGMVGWMSPVGTFLVWLFCLTLAIQMLTGISWPMLLLAAARKTCLSLSDKAQEAARDYSERRRGQKEAQSRALEGPTVTALPLPVTVMPPVPLDEPPEQTLPALPGPAPAPAPPEEAAENLAAAQLYEDEAEEAGQPEDTLVHPLLLSRALASADPFSSPDAPAPERDKPQPSFPPAPFPGDEEENLPPWVRDFEEGRVGVQPAAEEAASALASDADLLDILWGPEEREPQQPPAAAPGSETLMPQPSGEADAGGVVGEYAASAPEKAGPEAAPDSDHSASPQTEAAPPLVSAKTAAAVVALRAAGFSEPDIALSLAALAADGNGSHEEDVGSEPTATADGLSGEAAEEEAPIPVAAMPVVEAATEGKAPNLAAKLAQRLIKPARAPLPPLDLLEAIPPSGAGMPRAVLEEKGHSLMTCLRDFGIQGELVGITPGPVVTMFEVRPAPGVRVSRIANLSDDLALALKAVAVRIQAPVPGTDTVGIEIPNEARETVCLRELLGSQLFRQAQSLLTLILGKDIAGNPAVADLAAMPHLLVAGATGAGKSVGINSIILSLIYKARPDEVKLLLIDPKRVEMAIYADLPHLVHPVVTEMQLAKNALEWAVAEMDQRYDAIGRAGVRNIAAYNAKVAAWGDKPPEGLEDLKFMPYLVIIIDELADLMLVAAKEVETSIVRLAQLARAAGIHLILATQRPSVDVVTGLIKANFPCRISFQVTSKHDSRTILDTVGAEHLLGKGDMLYKPAGGKFQRMHGAFVSDKNVNAVVKYWKSQQRPDYQVDFGEWAQEAAGGGGILGGNGDILADPMYNEAVEFVRQQGKASISLIQRKFRIGFNKAARFVEQMEQDGIIGPADGSKPRLVMR